MLWVLIGSASMLSCRNKKNIGTRGGIHISFFLFLHETYIVGIHWKCLAEPLLMSSHNICFEAVIRKKSVLFW